MALGKRLTRSIVDSLITFPLFEFDSLAARRLAEFPNAFFQKVLQRRRAAEDSELTKELSSGKNSGAINDLKYWCNS